ncbi:DUF2306 domain-containing protein [Arthrobacter citreus]|nr:DUF2306 domain-containing protein [Arthrobacter citreus]
MKNRRWIVISLSVLALMWMMHTVTKNFIVDPNFTSILKFKEVKFPSLNLWIIMIRLHIILSIIALISGPIGLSKRIRKKQLVIHRWNGRIYVGVILFNIIPGYFVSFYANGSVWSITGFILLNTIWILTTITSYRFIRKGQVTQHRNWILRSFFLTFANLTIHLVLSIFYYGVGLQYDLSYPIAVWSSFILNLLFAELVIRNSSI